MTDTYAIYSSKTLGGLVVERDMGWGVWRAVLRSDGSATVWFRHNDRAKFGVHGYGKNGRARAEALLAEARAALAN